MAESYVGEIRMFGGNFAPVNWEFCKGQLLSIADNEVLFQLIGTTYGGDGQNTFGLPNLQSRVAIHQGPDTQGNTYGLGQTGGTEQVTLTTTQLPVHNHPMLANGTANSGVSTSGQGGLFAVQASATDVVYGDGAAGTIALDPRGIGSTTGNLPHSNIKPFQCVNFIISLYGVYPSQT